MSDYLPDSIRQRLPYLLAKTHQRLTGLFEQHTERLQVTGREYATLLVVEANNRLWQSEVADALELDRTTMTYLVDGLEKRGWLIRQRDPADRRAHVISLTDDGAAIIDKIRPATEAATSELLSPLSEPECDQLRNILTRLLAG